MTPMLGRLFVLPLLLRAAAAFVRNPQAVLPGDVRTRTTWGWDDCGSTTDAAHIVSLEVSPDPPVPGQNLTVHVTGRANEIVEEGAYAVVTVSAGRLPILKRTFDLCDAADQANATVRCPVQKGAHEIAQTVELPRQIPRFSYEVKVRGYTADDEDMVCLDINIDFRQ